MHGRMQVRTGRCHATRDSELSESSCSYTARLRQAELVCPQSQFHSTQLRYVLTIWLASVHMDELNTRAQP